MTVKFYFDLSHRMRGMISSAYLFRYMRDADYIVESLLEPYLWFSGLAEFNDPFESENRLRTDISDEMLLWYFRYYGRRVASDLPAPLSHLLRDPATWKRMRSEPEFMAIIRESYVAAQDALFRSKLDEVSVCCCSDRADIPLMWGHYADGHRGICLVLDAPFLLMGGRMGLQEVRYVSKLATWNHAARRRALGDSDEYQLLFDRAVLATKFSQWKYEREHRLITHSRGAVQIPEVALAGVILGSRMAPDRVAELTTVLMDRWGHVPGFTVTQSSLDVSTGKTWAAGYPEMHVAVPGRPARLPSKPEHQFGNYLRPPPGPVQPLS